MRASEPRAIVAGMRMNKNEPGDCELGGLGAGEFGRGLGGGGGSGGGGGGSGGGDGGGGSGGGLGGLTTCGSTVNVTCGSSSVMLARRAMGSRKAPSELSVTLSAVTSACTDSASTVVPRIASGSDERESRSTRSTLAFGELSNS
jgi:hypothetical protein